jgi:DNA-binding response OmpR family regulator
MSANSDNATKLLALNVGMDLFIPKPFILSELEPLINQLLHRKSSKDSGKDVENCSAPTRAELELIGDDKVYLR